jgi:glucokinase
VTRSALAIDFGATKISCAVVSEAGEVRERLVGSTPPNGREVIPAILELASGLQHGMVEAIGVGAAGIIDPRSGVVTGATSTVAEWVGVRLRDELEAAFGLPTTVVNDVHAHAWGEWRFGAGRERESAFVVAVGTGIGAVLVTGRGLEVGVHGASGHFGHIACPEADALECSCGRIGHLECVASGGGILTLFHSLGGSPGVTSTKAVFADYGVDPIARATVERAAAALGHGLGGAVNLLDPEIIVLAGGMRDPGGPWLKLVGAAMREVTLPALSAVPIVPAQGGDDAALIGAAHYALTALTEGGSNVL